MPLAAAAHLEVVAYVCTWSAAWWVGAKWLRAWRNRCARGVVNHQRARDVFTLHPGTKGLITDNPSDPLMWQLPSGRIVYHRYWHCLEGVKASE